MARGKKAAKSTVPADFYVKFNAAVGQTNLDEPKLGDMVEYTVAGEVVKVEETKRGDGETRAAVTVKLADAWPEGSERPATQPLLFDRTGGATADATGRTDEEVDASADEGDEIRAANNEAKASGVANAEFSHGTVNPPKADD